MKPPVNSSPIRWTRLLGGAALLMLCAGGSDCKKDDPPTGPIQTGPPCECYVSSDCDSEQSCHWNFGGANCVNSGKMDGLCVDGEGGFGGPNEPGTTTTADGMSMVSAGFDSFIPAILDGGGVADPMSWEAMEDYASNPTQLQGARTLVHEALTITLGWDVGVQQFGRASSLGNVRLVTQPVAALAMLEATRDGVLMAIDADNPAMVSAPLVQFWNQYPYFEPNHLGRCYPHGHDPLDDAHPIQCQIENLEAMVGVALASTNFVDP